MRISLLQEREPFYTITARTLIRFWGEHYGQNYSVRWLEKEKFEQDGSAQIWLMNAYLNAIFTPDISPEVFSPIRQEFSRSLVWWKRPFQKAYVQIATSSFGAPIMAHSRLVVEPSVPHSNKKIIVPGNHKIRLMDQRESVVYSILKQGFDPEFFSRELENRHYAVELGIPVPPLIEVAKDDGWFSEKYICGTPLNRLANSKLALNTKNTIIKHLTKLHDITKKQESIKEYAAQTYHEILKHLGNNFEIKSVSNERLIHLAHNLYTLILKKSSGNTPTEITTVRSHGDFQPANVILSDEGVWLIDWEYSKRRQIYYDNLVFTLNSRSPEGLAKRLSTFVKKGINKKDWSPINYGDDTIAARSVYASLFLLEEFESSSHVNSQSVITNPDRGLTQLIQEIELWLKDFDSYE